LVGKVLRISCDTLGGELRVAVEERKRGGLHLHIGGEGGRRVVETRTR
jgi:hypothetical protein